ncbi:hypothetical protein GIW70_18410 [Pseudomonas syringae]|nr:hypothetical protein [Pseudomonas syringae]MCF5070164.1 hypothetical protein [Pseudomonas syringae]
MWAKKSHTKFWAPGRTLRIAFLDGTREFKDAVIAAANNWLPHVNLKFDFVEGEVGDIRIQSDMSMYWSYIGTDALLYPEGPTMNLPPQLFHAKYFAANVMHEFGHMLGAEHEQVHPLSSIPWDKKAFYEYHGLSEHPNEEEDGYETVQKRKRLDAWYLDRLDAGETVHSPYDRRSIMHYEIRQQWTEGDFQIFLNLDLSEQDKAFMAKAYPNVTTENN